MTQTHEHAEHAHPSNRTYILVAAILGLITAVEVGVFYMDALEPVLVPILLVLSAAKFTMVVGFFMHLKFDSKLYRALFVGPLVVAIAVMMAMFLLYGVFSA